VDAQQAEVGREMPGIEFDVLNVPHDRFMGTIDTRAQCHAGRAFESGRGPPFHKGGLAGASPAI